MRTHLLNSLGVLTVAILISLESASVTWAASYYVSPSGNDSNLGTSTSAAFRSIQKALNVIRPGDTVMIRSGTYYEGLKIVTSGTSSARITVQNYNGESVTINSGTSRTIQLTRQAGYYTFSGLKLVATYVGNYKDDNDYSVDLGHSGPVWWGYGPPDEYNATKVNDDSNGNNGFIVENCSITGSIGIMGHFNTVRNCTLNGNGQFRNGIRDKTVVSHHNTYTRNTIANYPERGIWTMSNTSDIVITYNDISHYSKTWDAGAIDLDGAYLPIQSTYVGHNVIHDPDNYQSAGILLENAMNCTIDGNTIWGSKNGIAALNYTQTGSGGNYAFGFYNFQVQDNSHLVVGNIPYVTRNVYMNNLIYNVRENCLQLNCTRDEYVYNNTFFNCGAPFGAIALTNGATSVGTTGVTIQNNILANSSWGVLIEAGGSTRLSTNNLFFGNTQNGQTGTSYQVQDPKFVNLAANDFTLQSGSPAIDKGVTIAAVKTDKNGMSRPGGSAYDIGAYESSAANPTPTPTPSPTPTDPIVPQSGWTLRYVDSQETAGENGAAQNAFDGNPATFWMTQWSPWGSTAAPLPHEIQIDLGKRYTLTRVRYLPRQDEWLNGNIKTAEIYVSEDGVNWGAPVAQPSFTYSFDSNGKAKEMDVIFPATLGRMIRIRALTEVNGNPWTSIAEINAFGVPVAPTPTPTPTATPTATPTVVSITSPAAGASIKGIIPILATVADGSSVTEVEFYLDGAPLGSDSSPPYAFSWSTVSTASGIHVLTAKAYHAAAGPSASNPVTVVLRRVPKAPTITLLK